MTRDGSGDAAPSGRRRDGAPTSGGTGHSGPAPDRARARDASAGASLGPPRLGDAERTEHEITGFVREVVADAGAEGAVVNLSGGVDSAVAATLAAEALGSSNVCGLVLPADANRDGNIYDAHRVAEELAIDYHVIEIQPLLDRIERSLTGEAREAEYGPASPSARVALPGADPRGEFREATGNAAARIRMLVAYFAANTSSRLVLGTGNRTELLLGYFTKYGDGGVDLLPLGDLYKSEVRSLARHLDVREALIEKRPTAGLWAGQDDESELGAPYPTIDAVLHHLLDRGRSPRAVADGVGTSPEMVRTLADMVERTAHKRAAPPTPSGRLGAGPR